MALSEWVTDDDICAQLRLQFDYDEMWDMDFKTVFSHVIDRGEDLYLELRGRKFSIDKITGAVTEVNQ
ncbi:hypothetical protein [Methanobrevibacter sp.]|uniref:hypothetical protein n=1 Tax=Methanobrevibacter sp. TaxID=66852 RepID=UPI00388DA005